jgi:hypothetical protein
MTVLVATLNPAAAARRIVSTARAKEPGTPVKVS